jgi:ribonuclease R
MHTILTEYGLPYTFEPQIEQEANNISEKIHLEDIQKEWITAIY